MNIKHRTECIFLVDLDKWENENYKMNVLVFSDLFLIFFNLEKKNSNKANFKNLKKFLKEIYDYYDKNFIGLERPVIFERKGKFYIIHKDKKIKKIRIKGGENIWEQLLEL